ncbi:MAG: threonylcarbamoyl-AMP synthase [Planctomycetes bacterium]|nr:threonylcarbamoyl-AMP synthase [Planctomycetota bacterium]
MPSAPDLTELLPLTPGEPRDQAIARAIEILQAGGVIAIPTETVYGLVCDAKNESALARIRKLKQQPEHKPFQHLISSIEQAQKLCTPLGRVEKKLMRCYWPGPLTLVLKTTDNTLGLRLPDHPEARDILLKSGLVLAATSANPHGEAPARTAPEVSQYFDGQVEAILDGGVAREGEASTVAQVDHDQVKILREGSLEKEELLRAARFIILFVSEESTVRAAIASVIFRHLLSAQDFEAEIAVAANFFDEDAAILPKQAVKILEEMGYPAATRRVNLTAQAIDAADFIYVFNESRRDALALLMPDAEQRLGRVDIGVDEILPARHRSVAIGPGYRETSIRLEKELWQTCKTLIQKMQAIPA